MPTQELHQEREQRSFNEVQQYFMKNLYNMTGQNNGQYMQDGRQQQRQGGYQGGRGYQGGQGGR